MPAAPRIAYDRLGEYLEALSNPVRLEILANLRLPKLPSEIRVAPRKAAREGQAIARQSVERHLHVLQAAGLVARVDAPGSRGAEQYVLNHRQVFAVIEEMRSLTTLRPWALVNQQATVGAEPRPGEPWGPGPKLIAVSGPWEGRVFALDDPGPWALGRARGAAVQLDYDPYVSVEHAEVARGPDGWSLRDVPRSKNGTLLNFALLPKGALRALRTGDIVGIGRSLLVFRAD